MVIAAWVKNVMGAEGWNCLWQVQRAARSHIFPPVVLRRTRHANGRPRAVLPVS